MSDKNIKVVLESDYKATDISRKQCAKNEYSYNKKIDFYIAFFTEKNC